MLLSLRDVGRYYGARQILSHITQNIEDRDRIALIGPNGAGKTTLLNVITGALEADEGEVIRDPDCRVGYLRQNGGLSGGTIESEMRAALGDVFALEQELLAAGERMAAQGGAGGKTAGELAARYQRLSEEFDSRDGYGAQVRINTVLTGLGFGGFDRGTPVDTLSGGERTRLMLCKLLVERPDLLILDEATNHLDFRMLGWLEDYLADYRGAILTVSHDRYFLDRVTTCTWELENGTVVAYPAPYSRYLDLRDERLARMQKEYDRYLAERARLQEYVDRNLVRASTAQSAKSRLQIIDHLEEAEAPSCPPAPPVIRLNAKIRPVSDVLITRGLSVSVPEGEGRRRLLGDLDLHIRRGERVAVIGENGTGKSTLLRTLLGRHPPDSGEILWGRNTYPSYYEQGSDDLHGEKTALMELWDRYPRSTENRLRTLLGNLGLRGEDVFKPVSVLSGGERARIKLALLVLEEGNVLLLDEPTNHLDIPAKEALEKALCAYEGTLLIVSHDRWLLSRVPTRVLLLRGGRAESREGNYEAVRETLEERERRAPAQKEEPSANEQRYHRSRADRSRQAAKVRRAAQLESEISETEAAIQEAQRKMGDPEISSDYERLNDAARELTALEERLAALYEEWDGVLD